MKLLISYLILNSVYIAAVCGLNRNNDDETDSCLTPFGQLGECIETPQCDYIVAILKRRPVNYEYVKLFHCGYNDLTPKVCCPVTVTTTVAREIDETPKPDADSHEKRAQVNPVCTPSATPPHPRSRCCGVLRSDSNSGYKSEIDQNPWLVRIGHEIYGRIRYLCSGALISSQYILTAAHCVLGPVDKVGKPKTVLLGEYNITNDGRDCFTTGGSEVACNDQPVEIAIETILVHPHYNPNDEFRRHDIALIKLERFAPNTDFIRPICLPSTIMANGATENLTLSNAGWGTINAPHFNSDVIRNVQLPFVGYKDCQKHYSVNLWQGQLCAGGRPGEDSCVGDPGGPLIYQNRATNASELVGIYSFGPRPCALEEIPLVFTNISEYSSWIRFHIESSCVTPRGERGQCVDVYKCEFVTNLLNSSNEITTETKEYFSSLRCNEDENLIKVCCPEPCSSLDGNDSCNNLYTCPVVKDPPDLAKETLLMNFFLKSRCNGPEPYRVCCESSDQRSNSAATRLKSKVMPPEETVCTPRDEPPDPTTSVCCGRQTTILTDRTIGGTKAEVGQYPWLAIIVYESEKNSPSCGGVLISSKYVLTAAHCVSGNILNNANVTAVRLGEHDLLCDYLKEINGDAEKCVSTAIDVPVEKVTTHPQYNPNDTTSHHDIALIELAELAPYSDYIRPICLPVVDKNFDRKLHRQKKFSTAGWGLTNETSRTISSVKQFVELPYVPLRECQAHYRSSKNGTVEVDASQICAGGVVGQDTCPGDSGGPLMDQDEGRFEVVGVVSFGQKPCGKLPVPAVFTKVFPHTKWIREIVSHIKRNQ